MTSTTTDRRQGINSGAAIKVPCQAATTAAITLSGLQTVDGVVLAAGDRVLVKNQATAADNGVYEVDTGDWSRDLDFDGAFDVLNGTLVPINGGTVNAATIWRTVATNPVIPETSSMTFTQAAFSSLTGVTFTQGTANAAVIAAQTKMREIVSVSDYTGWTGDGVTDDTVAWTNAHTDLPAAGGAIFCKAAKTVISSVTFSKAVLLFGSGMSAGGSQIIAKDATSDVIKFTGSAGNMRDFQFTNAVTRTAGSYILYDTTSSRCTLENVYMLGWFKGVTISGVSDFSIRRLILINGVPTTGVGVVINSGLVVTLTEVLVDNAVASEAAAGIQIPNCGDVTMNACTFAHCVNGFTSRPGAGQIATFYANGCFFDNNTTNGVLLAPASTTGTIHRVRFNGCWFGSSGTGSGVLLDTNSVAGFIDGVTFIDPECVLNGAKGMWISGANTKRIKVLGGKFAQNGDSGITIQNGADNIQIIGATCGPIDSLNGNGSYGIANPSGATDDLLIASCQLTGNTTAGYQAGATGSRRRASGNNGLVTSNSGTSAVGSGATTAVVAHGLDVTPSPEDITINFLEQGTNDYGRWWISAVGSANFTLNVSADPGASNLDFSWRVNADTRI